MTGAVEYLLPHEKKLEDATKSIVIGRTDGLFGDPSIIAIAITPSTSGV